MVKKNIIKKKKNNGDENGGLSKKRQKNLKLYNICHKSGHYIKIYLKTK